MLGPMGEDDDHERLERPLVPRAVELPEERAGSMGLGLRVCESGACHEDRKLVRPILLGKSHCVPANPRPVLLAALDVAAIMNAAVQAGGTGLVLHGVEIGSGVRGRVSQYHRS